MENSTSFLQAKQHMRQPHPWARCSRNQVAEETIEKNPHTAVRVRSGWNEFLSRRSFVGLAGRTRYKKYCQRDQKDGEEFCCTFHDALLRPKVPNPAGSKSRSFMGPGESRRRCETWQASELGFQNEKCRCGCNFDSQISLLSSGVLFSAPKKSENRGAEIRDSRWVVTQL
jgi:hypothetical protein